VASAPFAGLTREPPPLRSILVRLAIAALLVGAVFLLLVQLVPGADKRLSQESPGWIVVAAAFELCCLAGYSALFHAVFARRPHRLRPAFSAQVGVGELGGFAIVPTGIGGPALRFWALRREGMPLRTIVVRTIAHAPVFNAPYVAAAVLLGAVAVLHVGSARAPVALALAPAGLVLAAVALVLALLAARRAGRPRGEARWRRLVRAGLAIAPDGLRDARVVAGVPLAILGSIGYWVGDCGVLWATFQGLGAGPPLAVIVLAYMLGQLGNILPLPGGVGGVEPATVGVLTASGVGLDTAAAAVLCYRAVSLGLQGAGGAIALATLITPARRRRAESRLNSG
jgi:putative heme transporter